MYELLVIVKKSKIILKNFTRAIILLIPYVGSSIDQITFGIKGSLKENELINKLRELEKEVRVLYSNEKSTEDLVSELIEVPIFKETLEQIDVLNQEWKKRLPTIKSKIDSNINEYFEKLNEEYKHSFKTMNERIKFLEDENEIFLKYFISINDILNYIEKETLSESKNKKIDISTLKESYQKIEEYSKAIGVAIKLSLKSEQCFLISPLHIYEYVFFPFENFSIDIIFLVYFFQKSNNKICMSETDLEDIKTLKYYLQNTSHGSIIRKSTPRYEAVRKFQKIVRKINFQNIPFDYESVEEPFDLVSKQMKNNHRKSLFIDVIRFSLLNSPKNNYFTTALSKDSKIKIIHNTLFERNLSIDLFKNKKIISPLVLALMAFQKSKNNKTEILLLLYEVFSKISKSLNTNYINFASLKDINEFRTSLKTIKSEIEKFVKDLQLTLLKEIKETKEVQSTFISAFDKFFYSYKMIGEDLDRQIISEINFEE